MPRITRSVAAGPFLALAALAALVLIVPTGTGQPPKPAPPERAPSVVHLVGHEDAALLARVQDVIDDWDPRRLQNPYLKTVPAGNKTERTVIRRPDLLEFIADPEAAVALGKAFFWDMQAGSDYGQHVVDGKLTRYGTACASCHYRNGADARGRNTSRIPFVAWDKYALDGKHPAQTGAGEPKYAEGEFKQWPHVPNADPAGEDTAKGVALVVGSQGVEPRKFKGLAKPAPATGEWDSEVSELRDLTKYQYKPEWSMFLERPGVGGRGARQLTNRNSPTTVNAVFADRQFHDGRAESTFNGFSIFGDHDRRQVLFKRDGSGRVVPVHVAISQASLASQAVGPVVNEVEMSYLGRTFPDLAEKLLPGKWLGAQTVAPDDSVLSASWLYTDPQKTDRITYEQLIRKAFRPEWWDGPADVELKLRDPNCVPEAKRKGPLTHANFSLYWGLSIMLYESTLISNRTPFDDMMRGNGAAVEKRWADDYKALLAPVSAEIGALKVDAANPNGKRAKLELTTGTAVFQLGFRTFLNRGCVECHSGPLFSEVFDRAAAAEPAPKAPIAFRLARTLLPNAQGDAIAMRMRAFRTTTETGVRTQLAALGVPEHAQTAWVRTLWRLLEPAAGDHDRLIGLVNDALRAGNAGPVTPETKAIARLLMTYEKTVVTQVGGRTFFTEDERVAAAEKLVGDVLVEKMLIPATQRLRPDPNPRPIVRPRLPIGGPLAGEAYAFYDSGFYNLGVAPPRFDRGNGVWSGLADEDDPADPVPPAGADPKATAKSAPRQSGAARGSAYQFRSEWKTPPASQKPGTERLPPAKKPAHCDPDTDPAVTAARPDLSWSRNVVPPGSGVPDLDFDQRRSHLHFFSRARRLVFDEEATGHRKPFLHDNELAFWGAFKTPTLRNVEVTAPYMHNGRFYELSDVINFYDAGGHLWQKADTNPDKHPAMAPLNLTVDEKKALRFFLACLTDSRVRQEQAPFDHPELYVVNGYDAPPGQLGAEKPIKISATGAGGLPALPPLPSFPPK